MKPIEEQNFYELLDLPVDAPSAAVEEAYARAMQHYGPDSVAVYALADPEQVKLMVERIEEAYLTLTDRALRQDYDAKTFGQKPAPAAAPIAGQPAAVVAVVEDNGQLGFGLMTPQKVFAWPGSRPGSEDEEPVAEKSPEAKEAEAEVLRAFAPDLAPAEPAPEPAPLAAPEPPAPVVAKAPEPEPVVEVVVPAAQPVPVAEAASLAVADLPPHPAWPPAQAEQALASASAAAMAVDDLPPHPAAPLTAEVAVETASAAAMPVAPIAPHAPPPVVEPAPVPAAAEPVVEAQVESAPEPKALAVPPPLPVKATADEPVKEPPAKEPAREEPKPAKPLPRMPEITEKTVFNGEFLRRVREAKGLNLRELADKTRISFGHLDNIEADRYDPLPAAVYLRGFLMSVARELKLDPLRVSKAYLELVAAHKGQKAS